MLLRIVCQVETLFLIAAKLLFLYLWEKRIEVHKGILKLKGKLKNNWRSMRKPSLQCCQGKNTLLDSQKVF